MNLNAIKGHRVVLKPQALNDPNFAFDIHREAAMQYLDLNTTYTVHRVARAMLYTRVWLAEVPMVEFNAIQFEDAESS